MPFPLGASTSGSGSSGDIAWNSSCWGSSATGDHLPHGVHHAADDAALCAGRGLHRLDDVLVAGAAAEIALEAFTDLLVRRVRMPFEDRGRGHDHPRRAVAALEAVLLVEGLLQ